MDEIKAEFRRLLDYGPHRHAGQTISIQHNPRFDKARFIATYPPARYGHLYRHEPDMKAIGEHLLPVEVRAFQAEGTPKVVVGQ
jgi:hypothetical protein